MPEKMKVACIGAGYFSRFHLEAWRRHPATEVIGVVDEDLSAAEATGLPAFQTLEEFLASHDPDIVDIITPPTTHVKLIETALKAHPKVVICQKPFCAGLDQHFNCVAEVCDDVDLFGCVARDRTKTAHCVANL